MANDRVASAKGHVVYIDDDTRHLFDLDKNIRFISTEAFKLKDYNCLYGFLCGIISEDYDVDTIYLDGLFNIVRGDIKDAAHLFFDLEKLSRENNIELYININHEEQEVPEFIRKYVA